MNEKSERLELVEAGDVFVVQTPRGYRVGAFYNREAAVAELERLLADPQKLHFIETKERLEHNRSFPYLNE